MHRPDEGVFEKGSHVLEYWLANSVGFALARPKSRRRVTAVVIDPDTRQAQSLVVRRSHRRSQILSADAVTAVDPGRRVLYTAPQRRRTATHGRLSGSVSATAAPALRATRAARRGTTAIGSRTRSGIVRLGPVAAVAGTRSWSGARKSATIASQWANIAGSRTRSGIVRLRPVAAAAATHSRAGTRKCWALASQWGRRGAAAMAAAVGARLQPLARAYAHNAATIAGAYARAVTAGLFATRRRTLGR